MNLKNIKIMTVRICMVLLLLLAVISMVHSAPRRGRWLRSHRSTAPTEELDEREIGGASLPEGVTSAPYQCADNNDLYVFCYFCGRDTGIYSVYSDCCRRKEEMVDFCMSWLNPREK